MNIFQFINQRRKSQIYSLRDKIHLYGEKISKFSDEEYENEEIIKVTHKKTENSSSSLIHNQASQLPKRRFSSYRASTEEYYRKEHESLVIKTNNKCKFIFDLIIDLLIYYSVTSSLYYLSFAPQTNTLRDLDTVVMVFFFADFFLTFFTEIKTKDNYPVQNLSMIAKNYAKGWMIFDLLSNLPLSYAGYPSAEFFLHLFRIFKLNRLKNRIKIFKVADFIVNIFYNVENKSKKKCKLGIIHIWELLKELFSIFYITYILACIWYAYSKLIKNELAPTEDFYDYFNLNPLTYRNQFVKTWYFIFCTITTVGYGDFYATNVYEMGLCILILVAAPSWFAVTIGKAVNIINNLNKIGRHSDMMGQLNIWISSIELKYRSIPFELKQKINSHYLHYWKNDRLGPMTNLSSEESEDFTKITHPYLKALPFSLRKKLIDHLFGDVFSRFRYFFNVFQSSKFDLALYLTPRIYEKGCDILKTDETVHEIFFKVIGKFSAGIILKNQYMEIFETDKYFIIGDYFAYNEIPSFADFKALSNVHGFSLPYFVVKEMAKRKAIDPKLLGSHNAHFYQRLEQGILDNLNSFNLETVEKEENSRQIIVKDLDNQIFHTCVLGFDQEKQSDVKIFDELKEIKEQLKFMKLNRKNILEVLREKIKNHIRMNTITPKSEIEILNELS